VRLLKIFFLTLLAIALVVFCVVNRDPITVSLFPLAYVLELPLFLFALLFVALGVVVAGISLNLDILRTRWNVRKQQQKITALENELHAIRHQRAQESASTMVSPRTLSAS
jgi:lipopolysaccharide assembly protein A